MGLFDGVVDTLPNLIGSIQLSNPFTPSFQPTFPRLPQTRTSLANKYSKLAPLLAQLDPSIVNSLIDIDSTRVATGAMPLTERQTLGALRTAQLNQPNTPPPERSILNLPGNIVSDLGDIVKSIPRLPLALLNEVQQLPQLPVHLAQSTTNPIAALATAPGVRLLPGAYTVGNIASGDIKESLTHPLMTVLDLLPIANKLASTATATGRAAVAEAAATGRQARPLAKLVTSTTDASGQLIKRPGLQRWQLETKLGRGMESMFGEMSTSTARQLAQLRARIHGIMEGTITPSNVVEQAAADSYALRTKYADIDIPKVTTAMQMADYSGLNSRELAAVSDVRDLSTKYGDFVTDVLGELGRYTDDAGRTEFYDFANYRKLMRRRQMRDETRLITTLRSNIESPNPTRTLDDIFNDIDQVLFNTSIRDKMKPRIVRAYLYEIQAKGFDISNAVNYINRNGLSTFDPTGFQYPQLRTVPQDVIVDHLKRMRMPNGQTDAKAVLLANAITNRHWTEVTSNVNAIMARTTPSPGYPLWMIQQIKRIRDTGSFIDRHLNVSPKAAARAEQLLASTEARIVPGRYRPLINKAIQEQVIQKFTTNLTPDQAGRVTEMILGGLWKDVAGELGTSLASVQVQFRQIARDVEQTWKVLRDNGVDPVFVHTVRPNKLGQVQFALPGEVPNTLSQVKERMLDMSPGFDDFTVALSHQGIEILNQLASHEFVNWVKDHYGVPESVVRKQYLPEAQKMAAATGRSVEFELQNLVGTYYTIFNPTIEGTFWGTFKRLKGVPSIEDRFLIPKSLADTIKDLHSPKSLFNGALDPATNLFRMAVVALSPRTLLYNIIGGGVMVAGHGGLAPFKYASEAWKMVNDRKTIPVELQEAGVGSLGRLFADLDSRSIVDKSKATVAWLAGRSLRRWWDEAAQARNPAVIAAQSTGDTIRKVAQKSYDFNTLIDDWYRAMSYMHGRDKALKAGVSLDDARKAGVELTRKSLQDWAGMTPIERSIMKSIFPFYGFMKHSIKYVLQYPFDHPLRASIIAKLGQSEVEELGALPHKFLGWLFVGKEDEFGRQTGLNLASLNPFGDIANMFTLAGFLGATNPVIQTMLESVGIEQGKAELYPSLRYDPESGRLTASHGNPFLNLVHNVIPQTEVLTSLIGINTEFNQQLQRDPKGALRRLASAGGLPVLWREFRPDEERMRAEIARMTATTDVKNEALQSGSLTNAMRYPSLQPYFQNLLNTPGDQLAQFRPRQREQQLIIQQLQELVAGQRQQSSVTGGEVNLLATGGTRSGGI